MTLVMEIDLDTTWVDGLVDKLSNADTNYHQLGFLNSIERNGDVVVVECDEDYFYQNEDEIDEDGDYPYIDDSYMVPVAKFERAVLDILIRDIEVNSAVYADIFRSTKSNRIADIDVEDSSIILRTALWGAPYSVDC